ISGPQRFGGDLVEARLAPQRAALAVTACDVGADVLAVGARAAQPAARLGTHDIAQARAVGDRTAALSLAGRREGVVAHRGPAVVLARQHGVVDEQRVGQCPWGAAVAVVVRTGIATHRDVIQHHGADAAASPNAGDGGRSRAAPGDRMLHPDVLPLLLLDEVPGVPGLDVEHDGDLDRHVGRVLREVHAARGIFTAGSPTTAVYRYAVLKQHPTHVVAAVVAVDREGRLGLGRG